jgi:hypothetical protein
MRTKLVLAAVAGTLSLAAVLAPAASASTVTPTTVSPASGSSTQSHNGLTCHNQWFNTAGSTTCTGNAPNVKWRQHVSCQFQGDHTGPWEFGAGSESFECNFGITGVSVQWG